MVFGKFRGLVILFFSSGLVFKRIEFFVNEISAGIIWRFGDERLIIFHRFDLPALGGQFFAKRQAEADALLRGRIQFQRSLPRVDGGTGLAQLGVKMAEFFGEHGAFRGEGLFLQKLCQNRCSQTANEVEADEPVK